MSEPPDRHRRHQTNTDRDLAGIRDRRTPGRGVPAHVEEETTPRPISVDEIAELRASDLGLADKIDRALEVGARNSAAIVFEQDRRNEVQRHGEQLAALAVEVDRMRAAAENYGIVAHQVDELSKHIRDLGTSVHSLLMSQAQDEVRREEMAKSWERTLGIVGTIEERTRAIVSSVDRFERDLTGLSRRVEDLATGLSGRMMNLEGRVAEIESSRRTERAVSRALTRGEKAKVGGLGAAAGAVASAIAWLIAHLS